MTSVYKPVTEWFQLAKTLKSHGTSGQLRIMVENKLKRYLAPGSFIFIDRDGSKVPYKITDVQEDAHFVISLEGMDTKEKSARLLQKNIFIPLELVRPQHQQSAKNLAESWSDYFILDQATMQTHEILRTEELPQQLMAIINWKGKEIYIPLNDQFITNIDRKEKIIYMNIPEGMFEL